METDLSGFDLKDIISRIEQIFDIKVDRSRPIKFGHCGKSAGMPATSPSGGEGTWLRITFRESNAINERTWTGEDCASVFLDIAKPRLLRSYTWGTSASQLVWRADEFTLAPAEAISKTGEIVVSPNLKDEWWNALEDSLTALSRHKTMRIAVRQDLINRRITELAGSSINPQVDEWRTSHADLHWANITAPQLAILDWEGWGTAPRGIDAATLWVCSLLVSPIAERVCMQFANDLATRSGCIAKLFMCAELLRFDNKFIQNPSLRKAISLAANEIAHDLGGELRISSV